MSLIIIRGQLPEKTLIKKRERNKKHIILFVKLNIFTSTVTTKQQHMTKDRFKELQENV